MKIDLMKVMTDSYGKEIQQSPDNFLTLHDIVMQSLVMVHDKDRDMDVEQKVRLFKLSTIIATSTEIEFKPEDLTIIRERIGLFFTPIIVGRAFEHLGGI